MTEIAEGRMVVTRIRLMIPPMRGEAIVRGPEPDPEPEQRKPTQ